MIRDNALSVSGLLVNITGGPSIYPYQPKGYYAHLNFPKRTYKSDTKRENQNRRGVYMHWQRQFLHPMLRAFDAPSREECTVKRPISNTPLAALTLLNDPTFVEAAHIFAQHIMQEHGHQGPFADHEKSDITDERIRWAFTHALSRTPNKREVELLRKLYESQLAIYQGEPSTAGELISIGLSDFPDSLDHVELAAWTSVARAIFNLNETITRN